MTSRIKQFLDRQKSLWYFLSAQTEMIRNPFFPFIPPYIPNPNKILAPAADIHGIWITKLDDIVLDEVQAGRSTLVTPKISTYYDGRKMRLLLGDILENAETGDIIKLISDPLQSADPSDPDQRWEAILYDRSKAEEDARRFEGLSLDAHLI